MPGLSFVQSCIFLFNLSAWSRSETRTRTRTLRRARHKTRTRCGAMSSTSSSRSFRTTPADDKYLWLRDFLPSNTNLPSGSKSILLRWLQICFTVIWLYRGSPRCLRQVPIISFQHRIPLFTGGTFFVASFFYILFPKLFISTLISGLMFAT